jgi:putative oxidoreductase
VACNGAEARKTLLPGVAAVVDYEAESPERGGRDGGGNIMMEKLEGQSDLALLIGRLFYSSLFLLYGYFKVIAYSGTATYMAAKGLPAPSLFALLAIVFELGGGLLMLVGYQTRPVALALAVYTLVAAFIAHTNFADANQLTHFMKNMAIVGGSLAFFVSGAGAYSLDRRK